MSLAYFSSLLLLAKYDGSQIPVIFARYARSPEQKDIASFRQPAAAKAGETRNPPKFKMVPFKSLRCHLQDLGVL